MINNYIKLTFRSHHHYHPMAQGSTPLPQHGARKVDGGGRYVHSLVIPFDDRSTDDTLRAIGVFDAVASEVRRFDDDAEGSAHRTVPGHEYQFGIIGEGLELPANA
jgi:hypothetical protein